MNGLDITGSQVVESTVEWTILDHHVKMFT